jgi:hypothetical protein
MEEGVLEISGLVAPDLISGHRVVMVDVKLQTMDPV